MRRCPCSPRTPYDPTGLGRVLRDERGEVRAVREERDCYRGRARASTRSTPASTASTPRSCPSALASLSARQRPGRVLHHRYGRVLPGGASGASHAVQTDRLPTRSPRSTRSTSWRWPARSCRSASSSSTWLANGVIIDDPVHDLHRPRRRDRRRHPDPAVHRDPRRRADRARAARSGRSPSCASARCIEDGAEVGNFVEVKKSRIGRGTKAKHLTYLGDTTIGEKPTSAPARSPPTTTASASTRPSSSDGAFIGSGTVLGGAEQASGKNPRDHRRRRDRHPQHRDRRG